MGSGHSFTSVDDDCGRPVAGLKSGLGHFVHGLGPGPGSPDRPVPVILQILDPTDFDLSYTPGDRTWQVLSNDQNRFGLPASTSSTPASRAAAMTSSIPLTM